MEVLWLILYLLLLLFYFSFEQLGTFSVNGERAYSPFVTNYGHADNSSTFVPCIKSMAAGFDRKIHNFPHGGLPYKFVRRNLVT